MWNDDIASGVRFVVFMLAVLGFMALLSRKRKREADRRQAPQLPDFDLSRMLPPRTMTDPAAWDRYWQNWFDYGQNLWLLDAHLFCDDGQLVDAMRMHGLKKVLCVGNGLCLEPRALARMGFEVTAVDLSPVATEAVRRLEPRDEFLAKLVGGRTEAPGGQVEFVVGDLRDAACCPGPFDVVIERRTLQLYPDGERPAATKAVADRLGSPGIFFSQCHAGAWKPPAPRVHVVEPWFVQHGWLRWVPGSSLAGRVVWTQVTTG
jgi:hypothetical protein